MVEIVSVTYLMFLCIMFMVINFIISILVRNKSNIFLDATVFSALGIIVFIFIVIYIKLSGNNILLVR